MSLRLKDIFQAVAYKELVLVDLPARGSNQHELNGKMALQQFFHAPVGVLGSDFRGEGSIQWFYFRDEHDVITEMNRYTFYDARARTASKTQRSEWRLYYYGDFLSKAMVGDALILVRTNDDQVMALVLQTGSGWLRAAQALFGINPNNPGLQIIPEAELDKQTLDFAQIQILKELGIEFAVPATPTDEQLVLTKFGSTFPSTKEMSRYARMQIAVDTDDCDTALVHWLAREEELFRALEAIEIRNQLKDGFKDVEHFVRYSLSVQNRRKARMGYALQNHLEELFRKHQLRFETQKTTEGKNTPDFLFPGQSEYKDDTFPETKLSMLAAKSSCKDRWRQVLTEAQRIPNKHLCTLEAGISEKQTAEMTDKQIYLVIPEPIQPTYTTSQRSGLLSVNDFVRYIKERQT